MVWTREDVYLAAECVAVQPRSVFDSASLWTQRPLTDEQRQVYDGLAQRVGPLTRKQGQALSHALKATHYGRLVLEGLRDDAFHALVEERLNAVLSQSARQDWNDLARGYRAEAQGNVALEIRRGLHLESLETTANKVEGLLQQWSGGYA